MKKIVALFIIGCLIIAGCSSKETTTASTSISINSESKQTENLFETETLIEKSLENIRYSLPESWEGGATTDEDGMTYYYDDGLKIMVLAQENIAYESLEALSEFEKIGAKELLIDSVMSSFGDYTIISDDFETINGKEAIRVSAGIDEGEYKNFQLAQFIEDYKWYTFVMISDDEHYKANAKMFISLLDSVEFTNVSGGSADPYQETAEISTSTPEPTATDTPDQEPTVEIMFRDIPWGTNYTTVNQMFPSLNLMAIAGESFVNPSVDAVLLDNDYEGIEFENNDINIVASALNPELDVAGYTSSGVDLYFAYKVIDGIISKTEEDSVLYGAQYHINPADINQATNDLISKLSSLYGEPTKNTEDIDYAGNKITYTYWYGANNTELVLKSLDASTNTSGFYTSEIVISYAWREGDNLMQQASDAISAEAIANEGMIYENNSVEGL